MPGRSVSRVLPVASILLALFMASVPFRPAQARPLTDSHTMNLAAAPDSLPPPIPPDSLVFDISQWHLEPYPACFQNDLFLAFGECGCAVTMLGARKIDDTHTEFRIAVDRGVVCIRCVEDSLILPIGVYPAGDHTIEIRAVAEVKEPDGSVHEVVNVFQFRFFVSSTCPPPPGELPYVKAVFVGKPEPCAPCPPVVCPLDSIPVFGEGETPDNCTLFAGVQLLPSPVVGPGPQPPLVRFLFATNSCLRRPCALFPQPWKAKVELPPLPTGQYFLLVESALIDSCTDSLVVLGNATVPFLVTEPCSVQTRECINHQFGDRGPDCADTISPDHPVFLPFDVASSVALAALQGEFRLYPPGLRITNLEAVGLAHDMHLVWHSLEGGGASWVLFAEHGAPIPEADFYPVTVLRIRVDAIPGVPIPEVTTLYLASLLGSDSTGVGVPPCPSILESAILRGARICRSTPCDFNADGVPDVRDLVVMVHCLHGDSSCGGRPGSDFDCDRNGIFELSDVLCCAGVILGGSLPDTIGGRVDPAVRAEMGDPIITAAGVDVPLTLHGVDHLGAARLDLRYPIDRYEVLSVEYGGQSGWLNLHEAKDDRVTLGMISIDPIYLDGLGDPTIEATVHLGLKVGAQPGGDATLVETQFSAPDGASIQGGDATTRPLVVTRFLSLATPHPNPFSDVSHFSVTLSRPVNLEVGIYDLAGRRVASIFHGSAQAGTRDFEWRRRSDEGVMVPSGVYFYRAVAEGSVETRKVLVMGGD